MKKRFGIVIGIWSFAEGPSKSFTSFVRSGKSIQKSFTSSVRLQTSIQKGRHRAEMPGHHPPLS
jgi:hypothetical protein